MNLIIYDNKGITIDRYTVIINEDVYSMSGNALSPIGVNMYIGRLIDYSMDENEKISYNDLSEEVRKAINERIQTK